MPAHELDDVPAAVAAALALDPTSSMKSALKAHAIGEAASRVSAIPEVREALLALPARFRPHAPGRGARRPRHRHGDLPRCRCENLRHRDAGSARPPPDAGVEGRAAMPSTRPTSWPISCAATSATCSRAVAPLKPAPDAHLLDTTHLDIDAAFRAAVDIVEAVRAGRERADRAPVIGG